MAKDKYKITGSVRIGKTLYREGDEDALAKVATADQLARLTQSGAIEGFGKAAKTTDEAEAETAPASKSKSKEK